MAITDFQLPFTITQVADIIRSAAEQGMVIRRQRFNRPLLQRVFTVTGAGFVKADIDILKAFFRVSKGGCTPIALPLPTVGAVLVRFAEDSFSYSISSLNDYSFTVRMIEEPRPNA